MVKKKIDLGFTPSIYQQKIFDFVQHGTGNAIISALAGSGKTLTLVTCMKLIPKTQKCLFLAFNKSIVNTLQEKVKNYSNCYVKTMHSLGFAILRRNLGDNIEKNDYKYRSYIKSNINELTSIQDEHLTTSQINEYIDSITKLVDFARFNLAQSENDIEKIARKYDIPINFDEASVVKKVLKWGKENTNVIDYTDMVWLPVELSLRPIGLQYDWIFADEVQDFSLVYNQLMFKCFKRGTRFICVGDKNQCQPYGTKILMCDGSEKNIEDIKIGDRVVTYWEHDKCHFKHYKTKKDKIERYASKVTDTKENIANRLIRITTESGKVSSYTEEHICYVKFSEDTKNKYIVYLMCNNDNMFRIGTCQFYKLKPKNFALRNRIIAEGCQCAWILKICQNEHEAKINEAILSYKYSIPQLIFNPNRAYGKKNTKGFTNDDISIIYQNLPNTYEQAERLLKDLHLNINFPFVKRNDKNNKATTYMFTTNACNLFENFTEVRVFDENCTRKRTHGEHQKYENIIIGKYEKIIKKEIIEGNTKVVSLNVERDHNYVADGILTHNCINGFAGSNPEAFEYLQNYPNTQVFELPITYRCPTSVVDMAKEYVGNIQAREDAPDGEIRYDCKIKDLKDGDMVLARTKAPLLKLYTKLLRKKVQCYIKGSDIGLNLIKMLGNIDKEELNQDLTKDGVFVRLFDNLFTERNKLMRNYGLSKDDATLTSNIMERYDSINSLLTLSERLTTKTKLIKNIENIFKEENNGIILSTIHKAKGLEADNVYILCRSSMPSKLAHSDWERQQEENLIYVAITRPKQILGFISEKEIPASGSSQEPLVILNDLRGIEKQVCSILGKEPVPEDDNIELTKMRVKNATKIDEHSSELPQNTVKLNETKHIKPDDKLLDMLSSYLGNGGDMESLSKFLGK